ncbi:ATP-binding protein [Streptomyces sp. NPDC021224]|uniref:ATP-binding protein n=1 Tax=unclassified Streptomyces TaxID=2593676 RepID=UPI0037A5A169
MHEQSEGDPKADDVPPSVTTFWPRTPRSVGRARRELTGVLDEWGLSELTETAGLVLSELLTNAVVHTRIAGRGVQTRYARTADGVRIEVHDADADRRPEPRAATTDDERGRGLALVAALTGPDGWGVTDRNGVGKLVWATVAL